MSLGEAEFLELGTGRFLIGLVKKITKEADSLVIIEETDTAKLGTIEPTTLGSQEFKVDYNLKYAYVAGGMYHEISSKELIVKLAKAGMMGFCGTNGLTLSQVTEAILYLQKEFTPG